MNSQSAEPRLFSVSTDDPRRIRYDNQPWIEVESAYNYFARDSNDVASSFLGNVALTEPPDEPPVRLNTTSLPELVTSGWSPDSYLRLSNFESLKLYPSNTFRHLESELISEDALVELNRLTDESVRSVRSFPVNGEEQRWHLIEVDTFAGGSRDPVVRALSNPPIPEGVDLQEFIADRIGTGHEVSLALGSWMAKDNRFLDFGAGGTPIVTDAFRDRWSNTELSKQLQKSPFEQDLWFTPSNAGFPDGVSYRWVDPEDR